MELGDLVKDPNDNEFKEFLETIKKSVMEFESLSAEIAAIWIYDDDILVILPIFCVA
jgi:hypothetical protein